MKINGKSILHGLVIMLGAITFGTIMCYPSPTAKDIQAAHHLAEDAMEWSFYNSVSSLFAIAGPFFITLLLKIFKASRRKTVFVVALLGAIFWVANLLTKVNIWAGIMVRAFLGIVMGAYSSISPMYLVEIAPEGASGFFGCMNQFGIVLGIVFFDFIGPSLNYMELNYVGAAICGIQAIAIWFIPESPGANTNESVETISITSLTDEKLTDKKNLKGLLVGVALMLFQQFCGINAILTNLADIMNSSGLDLDGNYQAGIASLAQLVAVFIGGIIIDKLGRKIVWIVSNAIIVIFLLIFALNEKKDWSKILPLICIFLYQLGFGLGMGPVPWFIIPEYFDNPRIRAQATSIVSASNWIFSFCVIFLWPQMKKGLGMFGSLLFYMCVTVVSLVFGLFFVSEPNHSDNGLNNEKLLNE